MDALDHILQLYNEGIEIPNEQVQLLIKSGKIQPLDTNKQEREPEVIDGSKVVRADWDILPDKLNPPPAFVAWINSINSSWRNKKVFIPFDKYCAQAEYWFSNNYSINNYISNSDKREFAREEKGRIKENSLYYLSRYGYLQDGGIDDETGRQIIVPWECQKVICYLFDLKASFMLAKTRQAGITSVLGILLGKRVKFYKNYFIKFITENDNKGQEIFDDKIKYPLFNLPKWMDTSVVSDSAKSLKYGIKGGKGSFTFTGGKLVTESPYDTVINGGSPQLVAIDEAGNMPNIGAIIDNGMPTLYGFNKATKKQEMKRQICIWSSGGNMDSGGGAYEVEFMSLLKTWSGSDFSLGVIPLFFDCYAREGITDEFLETKMRHHYSKPGSEGEASRILYHQTYPKNLEDVFLRSSNTFIEIAVINKNIDRIHSLKQEPLFGEFSARWSDDNPKPLISESKIIGNVWEPGGDELFAPVQIFKHPKPFWKHRYYMGVDPIDTVSGTSNFAAAVWDNYANTVVAVVDFRKQNYKECYLQALLMAQYYDCSILFESNRGSQFKEFAMLKGMRERLVYNKSLPLYLQTFQSSEIYGFDNKGKRGAQLLNKLQELCDSYLENIWIERFFLQMKTFVRKDKQDGNATFKTEDHKYFQDDVIDAVNFAYVNAIADNKTPINTRDAPKKRNERRYVINETGEVDLQEVMVKAE